MQVTKTVHSDSSITLIISADQHDLTPIKDHVLVHFTDKVKVPGFREGTAPLALVERHVDQSALSDELIEHALNQLYGKAIDQEKIRPASRPEVKIKKFVPYTDLEFEAVVEIIGPIKVPDYKKIRLPKKTVEISAKEVDEVVKSLQMRSAVREEVERPAKLGDELVIDFVGKDKDGEPIQGADSKDYPLVLGSKSFIPGFEDNLIGLKKGDKKEFKIIFPKDYGDQKLQNAEVTFNVTINIVNSMKDPAADDKFAASVGPFKTMAELKTDIKKQLKVEKQRQADLEYKNELVAKMTEKSIVTVPKSLVEDQLDQGDEDERRDLTYRGQTWQEHLDAEGITEQQHRDKKRPEAERRVKAGLVLSEIAEQEGITITQAELDAQIAALKAQYQDETMQKELEGEEARRNVAAQLMTEKTINKLVEYASK